MAAPYPKKDNEFVAWYPLDLTRDLAAAVWHRKRAGYYVHIPFCTAICDYCGFSVERLKGSNATGYLDALKQEIRRYAEARRVANYRFVCGHFGGGTPSAIPASDLISVKALIDQSFDVADDAEITVEVNPISFTPTMACSYREAGINRISFGVQSFNDRTLAVIGRPHRAADVSTTLSAIREGGFDNYSLDLIYGVPGQTFDELKTDLAKIIDTGATHVSSFRLEIIPLTKLKLREAARLLPARLPDEVLNEMDQLVSDALTRAGYRPYGAFNYAKPGYESVHNEIAFMAPQGEYIGFGNSAYSYINDHVYCNYADVEEYKAAVFSENEPIALAARVNSLQKQARYFVLGLKFFQVSRGRFMDEFGVPPESVFGSILEALAARQLLLLEDDQYVLTALGKKYVNNVIKEFFIGASVGMNQYPQFVSNLTVNEITRYAKLADSALGHPPEVSTLVPRDCRELPHIEER